ncbi:uncharacterized protein APUU_10386A [Aspergillus puulaauensis]|uniref:F-box domain-containing protein n=1 Tax=Aspergillus puulaauensis TaxID=1220207 RepID=A0A7R8AHK7_9EURO|nr:uncharacterized protein APUU_10386A [Aspergillus puulaauensis]BCS17558.1 hypothetical protein APUU_10386A [Aspergillus puulaauensis]
MKMSMALLQMPNEILLLIFHQMPTIQDAVDLAHSCSHLYQLFSAPRNKIDILCSAANVPQKPNHSLDEAFSVLIRQPPSNWLLQSAHSSKYMLIELDDEEILDASPSTLLDFTAIQRLPKHSASSPTETLDAFLTQFYYLDFSLSGYYENMTSELISGAARLQLQLLHASHSAPPADLSGDTTVLALALHCLAMLYIMDMIDLYNVDIPEPELFRDGSPVVLMEQGDDERRFLPTVRVHRPEHRDPSELDCERNSGGSSLDLDREFHRMLEHVVHVSFFRLLDTADPRHWPTVLYVLVVLNMGVRDSLHPFLRWRRKLGDAQKGFDFVFRDLVRYYYLCTDGGQILSDRWEKSEYAARVQHDQVAVEHAEMLNRSWLGLDKVDWDSRDGEDGVEGFGDKVEYFASGGGLL